MERRQRRVHAILKAYEWSTCFRSVCSKHNQSTLQVETAKREKETLEQKMKDQLSEICLTRNSAGCMSHSKPNIASFTSKDCDIPDPKGHTAVPSWQDLREENDQKQEELAAARRLA